MNQVKHQPATPLPFEVHVATSTRTGFDLQSAGGEALVAFNLKSEVDTRYIAHAANSYPKLVEALRSLDLHCGFDLLNPCFDNRPADVTGQHWGVGKACRGCAARALLRDLGENV